jgi:hypothetical protein
MLELVVSTPEQVVVLEFEHSLLSLSKWESKHRKPFQSRLEKTHDEMLDYYQDMLLSSEEYKNLVYGLSPDQLEELLAYVNDTPTASSPSIDSSSRSSNEIITSELIYAWMTLLKIPWQPAETWHLGRLMILIQFINKIQTPAKQRPEKEIWTDWNAINEKRKAMLKTNG